MPDETMRTTRLQRAVRMERVPPEKWPRILARTVVGGVLALAGIGLLYAMVRVYIASETLSLPLLGTGVGMLMVGAHLVSGQIVTGSIRSVGGALGRFVPGRSKGEGE